MANDRPTNRRMIFGFHQARAAGIGGIPGERSANQINQDLRASDWARQLRKLNEEDERWKELIEHRVREGIHTKRIADEIYWTDRYLRNRARGRSAADCYKRHWRNDS